MKKHHYIIIAGILLPIMAIGFLWWWSKSGASVVIDNSGLEQEDKRELKISGTMFYVSPRGDDSQDGRSADKSMASIQKAISLLAPGDGLTLLDGEYEQDFVTMKNGAEGKEIIVTGTKKAIVHGTGKKARIIEVNHDYIIFNGFTVDGLVGNAKEEKNYRDKLMYIEGREETRGVEGVVVINMHFKNAGGECLRIKYFSQKNEIAHNKINGCGAYDFLFDGGGKNGEGIYIGTAPEQVEKDKNLTRDPDQSNYNWVHHNTIDTQGNECVDIKEGASFNKIENNICTGQKDKESAGLDSRGSNNIFRANEVFGCTGAGVRLGGDGKNDGINNDVIENNLHDNNAGGIKFESKPQGKICGNIITNNKKDDLVGEYGDDMKNEKKCN